MLYLSFILGFLFAFPQRIFSKDYIIRGTVKSSEGKKIPQALVTLMSSSDRERSLFFATVYTDDNGAFSINWGGYGIEDIILRSRHYLYQDFFSSSISLKDGENSDLTLEMKPYLSFKDLAEKLPSSSHYQKLLAASGEKFSQEIMTQCAVCHQLGTAQMRKPRDAKVWRDIVLRMEGMGALLTDDLLDKLPDIFSQTYDGSSLALDQAPGLRLPGPSPKATIREWAVGNQKSNIQNIVVHQNGLIYAADMGLDRLYALDPVAGKIETWHVPESGVPVGGRFSGFLEPQGTTEAQHGLLSLQVSSTGVIWMTSALSGEIQSFDPKDQKFMRFPVKSGVYPHTLRFDQQGRLWFSLAYSNQVGVFDPVTQGITFITLPSGGFISWLSNFLFGVILDLSSYFPQKNYPIKMSFPKLTGFGYKVFPFPAALDISPVDGSIWYAKLHADKIGRIDPITFAIEEIELPLKGPGSMRFAKDGILWISSMLGSAIMKYDTVQKTCTPFSLPTLAGGQHETPYALNIHPQTQDVWIAAGSSDRLVRFNPKNEEMSSYPLPTRVTLMHSIDFRADGDVCASYSNLPASSIEGGRPKIMCLKTQAPNNP